MSEKVKIVAITGPTATGKTALAVELAKKFDGEIISVDSRQVYRFMDLGTGKDLEEYGEVPYHLINIADPWSETYNLSFFCRDAFAAIRDIASRGKLPILCGGTALYLDALLKGYRLPGGQLPPREKGVARSAADYTAAPSFTPPFELDPLVIGVLFDRKTVRERIEKRLDARFDEGMIDEVAQLNAGGVSFEKLEFFVIAAVILPVTNIISMCKNDGIYRTNDILYVVNPLLIICIQFFY
jgi:tRNA dimethylallyltransferase